MATYYVDNVNGNNGNAGTSEVLAKQTIAAGVALLTSPGDILYIQATGTNYTLTSAQAFTIDGSTSGKYRIEGYTTTPGARDGRPVITSATNSVNLFELNAANFLEFVHLKFTHTAGTRGAAFAGVTAASNEIRVEDCEFDGCSYAMSFGSREINTLAFVGNTVINCTSGGVINAEGANGTTIIVGNTFRDNSGSAWDTGGGSANLSFFSNVFADNGRGVYDTGTTRTVVLTFLNNTFANHTNDGIRVDETSGSVSLALINNIFYGNGAYGINLQDGATENNARLRANRKNAYGSNTSGARNNLNAGTGDVTLTADPFTNAASNDFTLNNTAGGGAACRQAGFP